MSDKLVLLGGGGHCISVLDAAYRMHTFSEIVVLDPNMSVGSMILDSRVAGGDDDLPRLVADGFSLAFVTVGSIKSTALRRKLFHKAKDCGLVFPNIVDPSAVVSDSARLGQGIFVGKNAVINAQAEIGDNCIINSGAIVEHGSRIREFSHVSVGSVVCGDCIIDNDVLVGANSTVIQGIHIKANSFIQAGEVVLKNV